MYASLLQLPSLSDSFLNWVDVVQAIGGLVLSLLIYLVYRNIRRLQNTQTDILKAQTSIMENQNRILEAEYLPDLSTEIVNSEQDTSPQNELYLKISNNGRGKAKNLHTMVYAYRLSEDSELNDEAPTYYPTFGGQLADWGFSIASYTNRLVRTDSEREESGTGVIYPDGKEAVFKANFNFVISILFSDSKFEEDFEGVVDRVNKEWPQVDALAFDVYVGYTDDTNQFRYERVRAILDVEIKESANLTDAIRDGRTTRMPMRRYVPEGYTVGEPTYDHIDSSTGKGILEPKEQ